MRNLVRLCSAVIIPLGLLPIFCLAQDQQGDERGRLTGSRNPLAGKPDAIAAGQNRFREGCATCHGAHGEGGRGPNLLKDPELRSSSDEQVFNVIRNGIRGTQMPPNRLPDEATWQLVSFVRNLNAPAVTSSVAGDIQAGRTLFVHDGCSGCHMVKGEGGYLGPDLTNIGGSRTVGQLETSLSHPNDRIMEEGFVGVEAVTKTGDQIDGIAKNNTNYSIQILDKKGKLHLLNKADLVSVKFDAGSLAVQHHPAGLSKDDMQNLIAYLSKQAIRPDAPARPGRRFGEDF